MANIRVSAQTVGGLALSVAAATASASLTVQRYRISRMAAPQTLITVTLFPLPLRPLTEVSAIATDLPPIMVVAASYSDAAEAVENRVFSLAKPFDDQLTAAEAVEFNLSLAFSDVVTAVETIILDKDKIVDSASVADFQVFISPTKNLLDDVTATEDLSVFDVSKDVTDAASAAEADVKALDKPLADSITPAESAAILVSLPFTDAAAIAEDSFRTVGLGRDDTLTATEASEFVVSFSRTFADSVNIVDTITGFSTDKAVEVISITDFEVSFSTAKIFADTANIAEADTKLIGKVFVNTASTADTPVVTLSKPLLDSVVSVDSFAFMPIKYAEDSVSVGENITLTLTTESQFDVNRVPINVGQVNGDIFEMQPTDGVLLGALLNDLMFNESTQE